MQRVTKMSGPGNEFGMYGYDVNSRMVWGFDETYGTTVSGNDYVAGWLFGYDAEGRLTDELLYTTGTAAGNKGTVTSSICGGKYGNKVAVPSFMMYSTR